MRTKARPRRTRSVSPRIAGSSPHDADRRQGQSVLQPEAVVDQLQVERQRDHEPARRSPRSATALVTRARERVRRQHEDDPAARVLTADDAVGLAGHHPGCRSTRDSAESTTKAYAESLALYLRWC